jgi:sRNA-binding carbon storage regulator CsrA
MRLTRKPGEGVELFHGSETVAKITIREISPGRVSIDIVAPLSVEILRSELIDRETSKDAIEVD